MKKWQKQGLKAAGVVLGAGMALTGCKRADIKQNGPQGGTAVPGRTPSPVPDSPLAQQVRDDTFGILVYGSAGTAVRVVDSHGREMLLSNNHMVSDVGGAGHATTVVDRKGNRLGKVMPCENTPRVEQMRLASPQLELPAMAASDFGLFCPIPSTFTKQTWAEFTKAKPLALANHAPKRPTRVLVSGFPDGGYDLSEGTSRMVHGVIGGTVRRARTVNYLQVDGIRVFGGSSGSPIVAEEGPDAGKVIGLIDSAQGCKVARCYTRTALFAARKREMALRYVTSGFGAPIENADKLEPYAQADINTGYADGVRAAVARDIAEGRPLEAFAFLKEKEQEILQHERALKARYLNDPTSVEAEMNKPESEGAPTWAADLETVQQGLQSLRAVYDLARQQQPGPAPEPAATLC